MCYAGYCTVLPLGLYVNILDLNIFGSQILLAGACCAASFFGLVHFYHDSAKAKKHACVCHRAIHLAGEREQRMISVCGCHRLHDDMRINARSTSGKSHVSHDDAAINTKAVNYSLAYNNAYGSHSPALAVLAVCTRASSASRSPRCGGSHNVPRACARAQALPILHGVLWLLLLSGAVAGV